MPAAAVRPADLGVKEIVKETASRAPGRPAEAAAGEAATGFAAGEGALRTERSPADGDTFAPDSQPVSAERFITLFHERSRSDR
jgi:hypothetical protein